MDRGQAIWACGRGALGSHHGTESRGRGVGRVNLVFSSEFTHDFSRSGVGFVLDSRSIEFTEMVSNIRCLGEGFPLE
jgi:hypothetical protein